MPRISPPSMPMPPPLTQLQAQVDAYYPGRSALLSDSVCEEVLQMLVTKPLLLALVDMFIPLGLLTFEGYSNAVIVLKPKILTLDSELFHFAREIIETATYYMDVGCQLHASEVVIPDTPRRQILKVALEEAGIGFDRTGKLIWPRPKLCIDRVQKLILDTLPRTSQALIDQSLVVNENPPDKRMNFFETMITSPGTWIVQLTEFCLKRSGGSTMQSRMIHALTEDGFIVINLSVPVIPSLFLNGLSESARICFLFCDPIALSFWSLVMERLRSNILRTVLFVLEPSVRGATLHSLLPEEIVPRLNLQLMDVIQSNYTPQFNWDEGIFSPVFLRTEYWQRHFPDRLTELPTNIDELGPLSLVDPRLYAAVLRVFCDLIMKGVGVRFVTGTWTEANCIWNDCIRLLNLNPAFPWFSNQLVSLLGDQLNSELILDSLNGSTCRLLSAPDSTCIGNNFNVSELRQSYILPFDCMIQRHHHIIIYYSAVQPLSLDTLYRIVGSAYQSVLIMASPEMLRLLN